MYSDKKKQEERYPYFLAIQISSWTPLWVFILVWRPGAYCAEYTSAKYMYSFFVSQWLLFFSKWSIFLEREIQERNLEIKHVSIQSTWRRLGSLINVASASWQKCKQACMKSRPCRVIQWIVTSSNQRWSQLCEMVWNNCKSSKIIEIAAA